MSAFAAVSSHGLPLEGDLTHSNAGSCYAQVVDRILGRQPLGGQILVTSSGAGEGKTVTAVNLALAFHARRIPVALVELSLVKPHFSEILGGTSRDQGVEDVLTGRASLQSVYEKMNGNNLVFARVLRPQDGYERLAPTNHLYRLLSEAKKDYQWTIFDGPAVNSSPFICSLAASIGLTLMIVRAGYTKREAFYDAYSTLHQIRPLVLLNEVNSLEMDRFGTAR